MREFQVIFTAQWSRTLGRLPARMSLPAHGGAGSSSAATHADIHVFKHRKLFHNFPQCRKLVEHDSPLKAGGEG